MATVPNLATFLGYVVVEQTADDHYIDGEPLLRDEATARDIARGMGAEQPRNRYVVAEVHDVEETDRG